MRLAPPQTPHRDAVAPATADRVLVPPWLPGAARAAALLIRTFIKPSARFSSPSSTSTSTSTWSVSVARARPFPSFSVGRVIVIPMASTAPTRVLGWLQRAGLTLLFVVAIVFGALVGILLAYETDLPQINSLEDFEPN